MRFVLWACLGAVILIVIGLGLWSMGRRAAGVPGSPAPPGSAWPFAGDSAPDFSLTDATGRTVTRSDLRGKVWIANFIFTRCVTICPVLTRRMSEIRAKLTVESAGDVLSVSFTVDPSFDTPDVMREYARGFHAESAGWIFLTGDPKAMVRVVRDGFHLMMNDPGDGPPAHSNRFVLVDASGRIRSSHTGDEEGVVDTIVKEALALRREADNGRQSLGNKS